MGTSPWIISQNHTQLAPSWTETLTTDSGSGANLTGLTTSALSVEFKNISNGTTTQGQGTFTIVQANPGIVSYQVASGDVAIGLYHVRVWVAFSNGSQPFEMGLWSVEP
jgi:hypothetical protein